MNDFHAHMNSIQKKLDATVELYPEYSPSDFEVLPFIRSQVLHSGEFTPPRVEVLYSNTQDAPNKHFTHHNRVEEVSPRKSTYMGTTITQEAHNVVGVSVTVTHKYKFRKLMNTGV